MATVYLNYFKKRRMAVFLKNARDSWNRLGGGASSQAVSSLIVAIGGGGSVWGIFLLHRRRSVLDRADTLQFFF